MDPKSKELTIEQKIAGTNHPYYFVGEHGFLQGLKLKASRLIAPINPFAKVGVETPDRVSW